MRSSRRLSDCESGAAAIEFAFVAGALVTLVYGIIAVAIALWTLGSLHYAAESAARCASVDATNCGSTTAIQTYALGKYLGQPLGGTNPFTYTASGCGHTVTASYTYSLLIPMVGTFSIPLTATACFP